VFNRYYSIRIDFLLPADLEFMSSLVESLTHRVASGVLFKLNHKSYSLGLRIRLTPRDGRVRDVSWRMLTCEA